LRELFSRVEYPRLSLAAIDQNIEIDVAALLLQVGKTIPPADLASHLQGSETVERMGSQNEAVDVIRRPFSKKAERVSRPARS
jgi:hypothetical protein